MWLDLSLNDRPQTAHGMRSLCDSSCLRTEEACIVDNVLPHKRHTNLPCMFAMGGVCVDDVGVVVCDDDVCDGVDGAGVVAAIVGGGGVECAGGLVVGVVVGVGGVDCVGVGVVGGNGVV